MGHQCKIIDRFNMIALANIFTVREKTASTYSRRWECSLLWELVRVKVERTQTRAASFGLAKGVDY